MQCDVDQSHHAPLPSQAKCNLNPYLCIFIVLASETVQTEARALPSYIAMGSIICPILSLHGDPDCRQALVAGLLVLMGM